MLAFPALRALASGICGRAMLRKRQIPDSSICRPNQTPAFAGAWIWGKLASGMTALWVWDLGWELIQSIDSLCKSVSFWVRLPEETEMSHLFWLSDEAWALIDPHLPRGKPGKPRVDDRRVMSGILHVLKTGCRWRDCPSEYGPYTTIYNRYNRWSARGVWQRLFAKMAAAGPVPEELSLDSSHVKAHRSAAGGKRGRKRKRLGARAAAEQAKSTVWPMIAAGRSPSP